VVIEHNLDVIKCADRLIDMGPEGGEEGGLVVAAGTPEEVAAEPASHTGQFLAPLLAAMGASPNGKPRGAIKKPRSPAAAKRKPRAKAAA
jgi:excinuclease ABC subunit A